VVVSIVFSFRKRQAIVWTPVVALLALPFLFGTGSSKRPQAVEPLDLLILPKAPVAVMTVPVERLTGPEARYPLSLEKPRYEKAIAETNSE